MTLHPTTRRLARVHIGSCSGAVSLLALLLLLSGCAVHHHGGPRRVGAPPRAAWTGTVHAHDGIRLVFEDAWHGYRVNGRPHHYFHAGHYYRWRQGRWERATRVAGPWGLVTLRALPAGLARREGHRAASSERHGSQREARSERREARSERHGSQREARSEHREARSERHGSQREARSEHREARSERHESQRLANRERRPRYRQP